MFLIKDFDCINMGFSERQSSLSGYLFYRCDGRCNCARIESSSKDSLKCDNFRLDEMGLVEFDSSFCYSIHLESSHSIYRVCIIQHKDTIIHTINKNGYYDYIYFLKIEARSESDYSTLHNVNLIKDKLFKIIENLELLE